MGRLVRLGKDITLEGLGYDEHNEAIIKVLKVLNVQEAINDNAEEKRFAFHLFEIFNVTSLEHIHPQNITSDINYQDFRMWFERRSEDFKNLMMLNYAPCYRTRRLMARILTPWT